LKLEAEGDSLAGAMAIDLDAYTSASRPEAATYSPVGLAFPAESTAALQRGFLKNLGSRRRSAARNKKPLIFGITALALCGAWVWIIPQESHRTTDASHTLGNERAPDADATPETTATIQSLPPVPSWFTPGIIHVPTPTVPSLAQAKPSCAVIGDSIAVGAGKYMRTCKVNAKIGISSRAVIGRIDPHVDVNVVSAGSNDPDNPNLRANLESLRSRAGRVIWILPIDIRARAKVQAVATAHGDPVVSFAPAGDHVHPRSEIGLARSIAAVMGARLG
jgi:hypothetical protein